jgi:tRNA threonylcarbamoyl adenosine modification protein YeaZ
MLILAIDTSTEWGSIALGHPRDLRQSKEFPGPQRHSSTLFPALAEFQLSNLKIDRIIVGLGPGSFSGIRVSLAAAHGIACAHQAEVVGICSAWSVAQQHAHIPLLGVFADARRGEYYCTTFAAGQMTRSTYLLAREQAAQEARQYTLAVSAELLTGVATRAYPRASDYLMIDPDSPLLERKPLLEPIYLREATVDIKSLSKV